MTSPINAVGPTATLPAGYDPTKAKVNASGTGKQTDMFDPEMFLNLLVAQLKYQDPTNPTDTAQFMTQSATLSQVQSMNTMVDTLSEMMTAQQTTSATSMIGKAISFVDPAGKQVSGVVDGVSFHSGAAMLHVGDLAVPLAGVLAVADPVAVGSPGAGDAAGTGASGGTGGTGASGPDGSGAVDGVGGAGAADGSDAAVDGSNATDGVDSSSGTTDSAAVPGTTDNPGDDVSPSDSLPAPDSTSGGDAANTTTRPDTISA